MAGAGETETDILSEVRRPIYRAIIVAKGGTVINAVRLQAHDDEQALQSAKSLMNGHAVELWDGARFVGHFPPAD